MVKELPRGAIVTLTGEKEQGFAKVEVEVAEKIVEGWISINVLDKRVQRQIAEEGEGTDAEGADTTTASPSKAEKVEKDSTDTTTEKLDTPEKTDKGEKPQTEEIQPVETVPKPIHKGGVPKDEKILLQREPSFFYGAQVGGGFSIISSVDLQTTFSGPSYGGGGHFGFFIERNFPVRLEVNYFQVTGSATPTNLSLGFFEALASADYIFDKLAISFGASYAYLLLEH